MVQYSLYRIALFLIHRLPLRVSYKIARSISDIQYFFSWKDKRAIRNNLKQIIPQAPTGDIQDFSREVFRNFGRYLVEFFLMKTRLNKAYIQKNVRLENAAYIDEALKRGKGGIILSAHIGNWEMGAAVVSVLGYDLTAVTLQHKQHKVNDLFDHQRECQGIKVVSTSIALRKCVEALKNNELVAMVADRIFSASGEVLDFFGRPTLLPKGPAIFSLKTGAAIIPTFLIRNEDNSTFTLKIDQPIYPPRRAEGEGPGDPREVTDLMKQYISVIEKQIRVYPSQWIMFREFGKD